MKVCELQHVSFGYFQKENGVLGKKTKKNILEDISISLEEGEILGLVGESGCGKSTLAKCIVGLERPDCGRIEKESAQMVFQDNSSALNPAKTVGWILEEVLRMKGEKNHLSRVKLEEEMMDEIELPKDLLRRYPSELSGGQRQRVGIAAALLANPKLLIADEPVSALDVTIQKQIIALLERLRKERGLAILFISHDLRVVYQLCDRVAVMKSGKVVECGTIDDVYFSPKDEYTRLLLKSAGIE